MKSKHLLNITVPGEHTSSGRDATLWCEIERSADSVILQSDSNGKGTYPLLLVSDVEAAGVKAEAGIPYTDCPPEVQVLALRLDDPRIKWGHVYDKEREDVEAWIAGELDDPNDGTTRRVEKKRESEKEERKRENAFLQEKGYRWEKKQLYFFGPGEFDDVWVLRGPDGELAIDAKVAISGEESIQTGTTVKALLTQLGYYGQEAIDRAEAEAEASAERREMRAKVDAYFADDSNRTGEKFENAESLFTSTPIEIEKHYPRRQFRIERDCIWREAWNSSDGDDWRFNNSNYGIAVQFKFDEEIADCLRKLAS